MTNYELQLLSEFSYNPACLEEFLQEFPIDVRNDSAWLLGELELASKSGNDDITEMLIDLIRLLDDSPTIIEVLNHLLIKSSHQSHQEIAMRLQKVKSPSTVLYVRKALETDFDYLAYTCSDDRTVAKWFSWILFEIGTPEALALMKEYTNSSNEGISAEMQYRLSKVHLQ